jgi:DNA-binding response OmpR family regulator
MNRSDKRILVVDDDDAIRSLLFTVLRRRGFQVDTGRNGVEALERCSLCRYSVILLDLMMPRMSGWEVIDHLKKKAADERPLVIVLTAGGEPHDLAPELVVGAIRKPFDIELLVDTVVGCLTSLEGRGQPPECPPAESERPRTPRSVESEKPN